MTTRMIIIVLMALLTYPAFGSDVVPFKVNEVKNLTYYEEDKAVNSKHKLNLFLPEGVEDAPLLLWIHGGAWALGDRIQESSLARQFAKRGIAVAAISYRLSPATWKDPSLDKGVQHPEHIKDVARAFSWLHKNADSYNYSRDKLFVSGYSAGGHLSALLSLDDSYLKMHGLSVDHIRAAIPIAGTYDIWQYYLDHSRYNGKQFADAHVKGVFGDSKEKMIKASPTSYISNAEVPMLVISEKESFEFTKLFEKEVSKAGVENIEFLHLKKENHKSLLRDLSRNTNSTYIDKIVEYIKMNAPGDNLSSSL